MQSNIMIALAKYKFLTTSQMIRLGIAKHKPAISRATQRLMASLNWVNYEGFSFTQSTSERKKMLHRKVEGMFFLTPKGAREVMERLEVEESEIKYPKSKSTMANDKYFHRKFALDCEIEANLCAVDFGYEVTLFDRDFDRTGSNRNGSGSSAKTKIEGDKRDIVPDGNFILENEKEEQRLFTFELHNRRQSKHIVKQLTNHVFACDNGSIGLKYGIPKLHRVLNVFAEERRMKNVLDKINSLEHRKTFEGMEEFFFFKTLDEVKNGLFYNDWLNLEGKRVNVL